jgi:pimeloyl-ACP methyl ester carboxylesterase
MPELQIAAGTLTLAYQDTASTPDAVVLLHGFPFTSDLWRPQIEALGGRLRIIAPDFRGFGASDPSPEPYTIAGLADDVAELLDHLGLPRAVVGGLSMGGYVAFELYRRHPGRVAALILADTRPEPDGAEARAGRRRMADLARTEGSRAVAEQLLPKLLAPRTRARQPEVEAALRAMMESARPEAVEAALMAMARRDDSRPLLPEIAVPVLVTGGAEDALTPAAETREWARLIPNARVRFIEHAGHVPNLEQPESFNELLLEFLARRSPPTAEKAV